MAAPPTTRPQAVHAPRGATLSCKGWHQEAALRMLMNNLDPEVGERPDELIVYGGTGKAARSWECFHAIVESLKTLDNDETLLVQSGKPVGIFKTHEWAPRVLIANANLVGHWSNWDHFRQLERAGNRGPQRNPAVGNRIAGRRCHVARPQGHPRPLA